MPYHVALLSKKVSAKGPRALSMAELLAPGLEWDFVRFQDLTPLQRKQHGPLGRRPRMTGPEATWVLVRRGTDELRVAYVRTFLHPICSGDRVTSDTPPVDDPALRAKLLASGAFKSGASGPMGVVASDDTSRCDNQSLLAFQNPILLTLDIDEGDGEEPKGKKPAKGAGKKRGRDGGDDFDRAAKRPGADVVDLTKDD